MRRSPPAAAPSRGWRTATHVLTGFAALLVMLFAIPHAGAAFKYLKVGMEVPEFSMKTLEGQEYTLAQIKGQPATLVVFFATWSPRSTPALEDAQKLAAQYADKGFRVLAVNVNRLSLGPDDRRQIEELKESLKLTVPIVIDAGLETYNAFGVVATPSTAVINAEGKIVHEAASYLRSTGDDIRESVEILLGVREAPKVDAVAAKPAYKPDSKALRHFSFGRTMLQRGNRDKAMEQLELAAAADPTYAAPRILLGQLLLAKKDPKSVQQAAELFAAAVEARPGRRDRAHRERGGAAGARQDRRGPRGVREGRRPRPDVHARDVEPRARAREAGQDGGRGGEVQGRARAQPAGRRHVLSAAAQGSEAGGNLKGASADFRRALEILMNLPSTGDEV